MKFNFLISKQANFYFFVSNLSEWHFSCGKYHNAFWRKELGLFSLEEKEALKRFKKIRCKHSAGKSLFELAFFTKKEPFLELRKKMSANEYKAVAKIFDVLENKFNLLYKKELPLLKRWKNKLNIKINNETQTNSIIKILQILFKTSPTIKKCNVYLMFSSDGYTGGGANIDGKSVSLEISHHSLENINHAISIIWHEVIHLLFQSVFDLMLMKVLKNRQKSKIVNEIAIASLFPRGILGEKFFKNKLVNKIYPKINTRQTKKILKLTESFVLRKKAFDEMYVSKVLGILKLPKQKHSAQN